MIEFDEITKGLLICVTNIQGESIYSTDKFISKKDSPYDRDSWVCTLRQSKNPERWADNFELVQKYLNQNQNQFKIVGSKKLNPEYFF